MLSDPDIFVPPVLEARRIADDLRAFVADREFPCVGAKAALKRDQLRILVVDDIRRDTDDRLITQTLQKFAEAHDGQRIFVSQAVVFRNRSDLCEQQFETHLWQRLSSLHRIDAEDYLWDPRVASDPQSAHFSMSIGGCGFFVVGLHPRASREARRFKHPTMIFNLHSQFEQLREEGRYEIIRKATLERDVALSGSVNPMLAMHGRGSAAAQYSGRLVDETWKCPFGHE